MYFQFRPYVSVAKRRAQAAREIAKRTKKGQTTSPVVINGRKIAQTFWGKSWCQNLESYSDYANRLPRGRTYVCNGSVVDLQIQPGKVTALVSGSELYEIDINISPLPKGVWTEIKSRCSGQIGSLVELLQGKLSKGVMEIVTTRDGGMFPKPSEIKMSCSCPDSAGLCKHLAAVMYGIGARLDQQPELLFRLRQLDHLELIDEAIPTSNSKATTGKTLAGGDVADVFGIELAAPESVEVLVVETNETSQPKSRARAVKKGKPTTRAKAATVAKKATARKSTSRKTPSTGSS